MNPSSSESPGPAADPTWITPSVLISSFSLLVSICAFVATIALFWFLNVRRGRLLCAAPHSFAATFLKSELLITLPLVLHNDGAQILVVQDMRMTLEKTPARASAEREALRRRSKRARNSIRRGRPLRSNRTFR